MNQQRGGTLVGFIMGLLVGLTVALGVAIYVTKMPIPFMSKGQTRASDADATEADKNKDWDPNVPLYGKKGAKSGDKTDDLKVDTKPEQPKVDAATKIDSKSADPLGELAKVKTTEHKATEPFMYFVQAGAYRSTDEAEAQRAKTVLLGLDAKISERDQGGRTVYRVRVGPMDKVEAERVRAKLEAAQIDSATVRVQR